MKTKKKFFVTITARKYNGEKKYRPSCWARFSTMEEAEAVAAEMNQKHSREAQEAMFRSWISDPATEWFTEESYKRLVEYETFYYTYEAKESK